MWAVHIKFSERLIPTETMKGTEEDENIDVEFSLDLRFYVGIHLYARYCMYENTMMERKEKLLTRSLH